MTEEQLDELARMINGPFDARDAAKAIGDLVGEVSALQRKCAAIAAERDYAQQKLIEFKQERAEQQKALRAWIGL